MQLESLCNLLDDCFHTNHLLYLEAGDKPTKNRLSRVIEHANQLGVQTDAFIDLAIRQLRLERKTVNLINLSSRSLVASLQHTASAQFECTVPDLQRAADWGTPDAVIVSIKWIRQHPDPQLALLICRGRVDPVLLFDHAVTRAIMFNPKSQPPVPLSVVADRHRALHENRALQEDPEWRWWKTFREIPFNGSTDPNTSTTCCDA